MTQIVKKEFEAKNHEFAIYVDSYVSINGGNYLLFIDSNVDFVHAKWNYFGSDVWVKIPQQHQ
jgi:vitamin K-dependent gamma-carboxylase